MKIKTVFFGTHTFATVILQALIDDPNISVDLVITQPDKPVGRKKVMTSPPVKLLAEEHAIATDQPDTLKNYDINELSNFDIGVTAQYGLLIPESILNAPKHSILNVHTSILPKYRGATPIQSALIQGETETGVTIMKMGKGLDTGPILLQGSIAIDPDDTYLELDKKLAPLGAELLLEAIPKYVEGSLITQGQDNSLATSCKQFSREDGKIDWNKTATDIYNQYRGLTPWPGVWTMWKDKRLKLLRISPAEKNISAGKIEVDDDKLYIGTSKNSIEIHELQLEGKSSMDSIIFLQGNQINTKQLSL
jgi:methionyl-tRNA formyltransferase